MLFTDGLFSPQQTSIPRLRPVLCFLAEEARDRLGPCDLLLAAVERGDDALQSLLARALRPGSSMGDLRAALQAEVPRTEGVAAGPRARDSFSPDALLALADFEGALGGAEGALDGVALELFVLCALAHLPEEDAGRLAALDLPSATPLLLERLAAGLDFRPLVEKLFREHGPAASAPSPEPFLLPEELVPSDDLTFRALATDPSGPFPFDDEPQYDRLFDAITRVLHRRHGRHVLLAGERGVAKNTVVAELARRAAVGKIPFLRGRRFLHVDCRHVPADESRERLAALLSHVAEHPELVVALDGFVSLLRSERSSGNKAVLLSALEHIPCQLIALVTPRELEEFLTDDADIAEAFMRIDVEEPDVETATKLLGHFALGLAAKFGLAVEEQAVRQAVVLSANYILNDHLPAKALKVLHRACEDLDYERGQRPGVREAVTAEDVVCVVSEVSGVPEQTLRGIAERSDYEQSLREVIIGQDAAVREVATELALIKAGMTDPGKPASVMLFLGQTGTGKTEMAKALARFYSTSRRLRTYTLGNCVEPHSVATIIGVPPGYVGHDQGGRLVNDLNLDPYCVFLLDEADKAHPDVLQPFLNLFDEGWVADQRGVRAYADKAIFILTTNVGQRMIADMVQQGKGTDEIAARMKEALSQIRHSKSDRPVFTPEFLARIKRIIVFSSLDAAAMHGIARKLVRELQQTWAGKRGKSLEVPEALVQYLGEQSHQLNEKSRGKEGGRIVRKLMSEWIEAPVQREISQRPGEYRACSGVLLGFQPPEAPPADGVPAAPRVSVNFTGAQPMAGERDGVAAADKVAVTP